MVAWWCYDGAFVRRPLQWLDCLQRTTAGVCRLCYGSKTKSGRVLLLVVPSDPAVRLEACRASTFCANWQAYPASRLPRLLLSGSSHRLRTVNGQTAGSRSRTQFHSSRRGRPTARRVGNDGRRTRSISASTQLYLQGTPAGLPARAMPPAIERLALAVAKHSADSSISTIAYNAEVYGTFYTWGGLTDRGLEGGRGRALLRLCSISTAMIHSSYLVDRVRWYTQVFVVLSSLSLISFSWLSFRRRVYEGRCIWFARERARADLLAACLFTGIDSIAVVTKYVV